MTADSQTGPSGTTNSTSEAYNNNGEPTAEDSSSENNAVAYGTTGSDPGCISTVSTTGTFPYADVSCDKDGNRICEGNDNPCSSDPHATNFAYDGADRLEGDGFGQAAPDCGAPGIPTAHECFSYDGNGELLSVDFTATSTSSDQMFTWSTASTGVRRGPASAGVGPRAQAWRYRWPLCGSTGATLQPASTGTTVFKDECAGPGDERRRASFRAVVRRQRDHRNRPRRQRDHQQGTQHFSVDEHPGQPQGRAPTREPYRGWTV